jgi:3-methyl-2-oxobutanoate hydroxymethyltransferase
MRDKITAPKVHAGKGGPKLRMITAYDAPSARIADAAEADIILVGDSLANVVLGRDTTLTVTIDDMVHHTRAVTGTVPRALVVGDMPWLSFHLSPEDTVRNAGRLVQEGGAEAVKLEGGRKRLPMFVQYSCRDPGMGHLGLTPQSVNAMGGYRVQGKQVEAARSLIADARALDEAGVFAIVLEGVPDLLAELITKEVSAPTIGIGAGSHCDGQVLVFHDVLGLTGDAPVAKFVRRYADLESAAIEAVRRFFADVQSGAFPAEAETYHMSEEAARALLSDG